MTRTPALGTRYTDWRFRGFLFILSIKILIIIRVFSKKKLFQKKQFLKNHKEAAIINYYPLQLHEPWIVRIVNLHLGFIMDNGRKGCFILSVRSTQNLQGSYHGATETNILPWEGRRKGPVKGSQAFSLRSFWNLKP